MYITTYARVYTYFIVTEFLFCCFTSVFKTCKTNRYKQDIVCRMESLIAFQSFLTVDLKCVKATSILFVSIQLSQFPNFTESPSCHVFEVYLFFVIFFSFPMINLALELRVILHLAEFILAKNLHAQEGTSYSTIEACGDQYDHIFGIVYCSR